MIDVNYIERMCEKYSIENYTINEDGSIDVDGNVNLAFDKMSEIPLKFGKVNGDFLCNSIGLTSLKNSPYYIKGNFHCYFNNLISLKYGPKYVGGSLYIDHNKLTSLIDSPEFVGKNFICNNNYLRSLEGITQNIGGGVTLYDNYLQNLKYLPKRIKGNIFLNNNKIKNIDYLPYSKELSIAQNPIVEIFSLFYLDFGSYGQICNKKDLDLIYDFKDREIIQNDILILDRLVEFLEDIGEPQTKEYLFNLLIEDYEIR